MREFTESAKLMEKMDRKSKAEFLTQLHHQSVDQTIERGVAILETMGMTDAADLIRGLTVPDRQFAHDRINLRRAEAILACLARLGANTVRGENVDRAFKEGDGVDLESRGAVSVLTVQEGKFQWR